MEVTERISDKSFKDILSQGYLSYSLSVIADRALPDVRDGLKPVHRRILYAMNELQLNPASGFKKCARVVGDVIGKYHPHGDIAVYDAMVRLAQDFAVRYPLVDGQGNFGNVDGDNAAAMRYTEARLTDVAMAIMENLDDGTVVFNPTYDGDNQEPAVMPCAFPNLLANGSSGIAVGMATNIPPHNVGEIADALQVLIKKPDCTVADLLQHIKGPDFPTGGELVESPENIQKVYETGRGALKIRARWEKEELSHGLYQIVVTEIPYGIKKSDLIAKIAKLLLEKKLPFLADIRDESAENVRIVLEPRNRNIEPEHLMGHLFKQTDLQINFNLNMNVLDKDHVPGVRNLKEVLQAFLAHRQDVLIRRSTHRLDKINHRMEILEGFLVAYLNLDEVIRIIREEDDAKACLMKTFNLTEVQADSILNMRLRSLRKLEEMQIKDEHTALAQEKAGLEALLVDEALRWKAISAEVAVMKKKFGQSTALGKRRTLISGAVEEIEVPVEAMIEKEPITVILSEKGWVRSVKGHIALDDDIKFKDGDRLKFGLHAQTTDKILLFATNGRFYTLQADKLPRGRGFGEPLRLSVDLPEEDDIICMFVYQTGRKRLIVSKRGKGFAVKEDDLVAQTRNGRIILNLVQGDEAKFCLPFEGDTVAIVGSNRKLLIFDALEIPEMTRGQGVFMQKYPEGVSVSDIKLFNKEDGLAYPCGGGTRIETNLVGWMGHRAQIGKMPPVGFPKSNRF
ncbi:MAG: DNA topoisomerase IV subunit A [Acetobacter sp.]|nr:DNA topoisomerase IV subunit A [Acetobacter sp.]